MFSSTGRTLPRAIAVAVLAVLGVSARPVLGVDIVNQASTQYRDVTGRASHSLQSNSVVTAADLPPPTIEFFADASYNRAAAVATVGTQLFLQIAATACNRDPTAIEAIAVTVTSVAGDTETFLADETAANSGRFRVTQEMMTADGAVRPPVSDDGMLQVQSGGALEATIEGCGSGSVQARILIDPMGVVFDSRTNEPIPGATLQLIDVTGAGNGGNAGGAARVFLHDGITAAPGTVVTGMDGRYQFPLVPPSRYRLIVTPPGDYTFPSQRAAGELPAGRNINLYGSYGADFTVDVATGPVTLDVPLDANPRGLFAQKTASRTVAEIAESVDYTVLVKNLSGLALNGLTVHDALPAGFAYVRGSARLDGVAIPDPQGGKGPALTFEIGALADSESRALTYRVLIGPGALQGDGVNRAQAMSARPALKQSNVASAAVNVQGGVFDDKAYVLGKVYADCDANGLQEAGEPGIPGVRLYLEDGSFVITDGQGQYSFYGVSPRTHVLKADVTTLPAGAVLAPISHRHAGDAGSRFIDVKRNELHRADFATGACSPALLTAIQLRKAKDDPARQEIARSLGADLKLRSRSLPSGDARALPASGIRSGSTQSETTQGSAPTPISAAEPVPLERLLPTLDNPLGFIDLHDGDTLAASQISVRVKGLAHSRMALQVNGAVIPDSRVGTRALSEPRQVEAREYIGVDLKAGDNTLTLTQSDDFGNVRATRILHVVAPGELARLVVSTPAERAAADGETAIRVHVRLEDSRGLPVTARTPLTLETSLGQWQTADLDDGVSGLQTFIEGGAADFELRAPRAAGDAEIRAMSGRVKARAQVAFVPLLRPLIVAGVIEGTLNLRQLNARALAPARTQDGFEAEITQFSNGNDKNNGGARAALFLKGKIKGDYLLTLGYDSDKDTGESLFRDIRPDQFYPVYGDSSVKGFDAQSTGRLYVRVDKNKSYLLAGDFTTQAINRARSLGAYNRSLTGVREHFENGGVILDTFASHDSARLLVEEIPADGTSGPYALRNGNGIDGSERVEILTRDRDQPSIILSAVPQMRTEDYELEAFTGRLLFRGPVPSLDASLNPVSIRVSYEVDQGGAGFWLTGVDSQFKLNERVTVGAALVDDRNPQDAIRLGSANATFKLGEQTTVITEVARSQRDSASDNSGAGHAERIELRHEDADLRIRAFAGYTDANFDNPSAGQTRGRSEAGAKASYTLDERTRLIGEALHSGDVTTGAQRDGGLLGVERSFNHNVKLEAGVRHVHDVPVDASRDTTDTTSVRGKVTAAIPKTPATAYGEYEQDVSDSDKRMAAVGGDYNFASRARLYLRHEFITSLSDVYGLDVNQRRDTTVFGLDTRLPHGDDRLFSEYRIADALSGREAEAAIGLRNRWALAEGLRLNTSLERVQSLSGTRDDESAAATGALQYTRNPLWKGAARLELRTGASSEGLLSTLGLAYKLTDDWTFLGRNVVAIADNKADNAGDAPGRLQERLQLGFAYRDSATNRVNGLSRYEFKRERNATQIGVTRNVHILSGHMNYQWSQAVVLTGQYAGKWVDETDRGARLLSNAHLLGARVTRDLGARWDVGAIARMMFSGAFTSRQSGLGTEIGYLLKENLWLSAGYNLTGFHDVDLSEENYTNRGVYLRLRFKFDESLFGRPGAQRETSP